MLCYNIWEVISVQRYFLEIPKIIDNKAVITGSDSHHIKNVMRMKLGDEIIVCDESSHCFLSKITQFSLDQCHVDIIKEVPSNNNKIRVDIAQSLIKKDAFEFVIQKSTELGVNNIVPLKTKNSIIKIDEKKMDAKLKRWNTIAKEASEQSERSARAKVCEPLSLTDLSYDAYDYVLVMYARGNDHLFSKDIVEAGKNVLVLIGPEGGFDQKELGFLKKLSNTRFFTIPNRILRSETASMYMLSVLDYLSEIGG